VVPPEEYDRMQERARFLAAVEAGLADAETGRLVDEKDAKAALERRVGPLKP